MIEFILANSVISLGNVIAYAKKRKKVKKDVKKMVTDNGYEVDENKINEIFQFTLGKTDKEALRYYIDSFNEKLGQFIPIVNIYYAFQNLRYFNGDHESQKYYDNYSDFSLYSIKSDENEKTPIEYMKEWKIIKESNVIGLDVAKDQIEEKKTHDIMESNIPTARPVKRNTQKLVLEMKNESK